MFLTLFSNICNYLAATYSAVALERLNVILHAAKDAVFPSLAQTSFKKILCNFQMALFTEKREYIYCILVLSLHLYYVIVCLFDHSSAIRHKRKLNSGSHAV